MDGGCNKESEAEDLYRSILLSEICDSLYLEMLGTDIKINGLGFCNRHNEYTDILSYGSVKRISDYKDEAQSRYRLNISQYWL